MQYEVILSWLPTVSSSVPLPSHDSIVPYSSPAQHLLPQFILIISNHLSWVPEPLDQLIYVFHFPNVPWTYQSLHTYPDLSSLLFSTSLSLFQQHKTSNYSSWNILTASCPRLCTHFLYLHILLTLSMQLNYICPSRFKCNFFCLVPMSPSSSCLWRGNVLKKMVLLGMVKCSLTCSQLLDCWQQKEARCATFTFLELCTRHAKGLPDKHLLNWTECRLWLSNRMNSLSRVSNSLLRRLITTSDIMTLFKCTDSK